MQRLLSKIHLFPLPSLYKGTSVYIISPLTQFCIYCYVVINLKQIEEKRISNKNTFMLPFIIPKQLLPLTSIISTLSFNSLYMVSYSSLNIFVIVYLKSLNTKSKMWSPQGLSLLIAFSPCVCGLTFLFLPKLCIFSLLQRCL